MKVAWVLIDNAHSQCSATVLAAVPIPGKRIQIRGVYNCIERVCTGAMMRCISVLRHSIGKYNVHTCAHMVYMHIICPFVVLIQFLVIHLYILCIANVICWFREHTYECFRQKYGFIIACLSEIETSQTSVASQTGPTHA